MQNKKFGNKCTRFSNITDLQLLLSYRMYIQSTYIIFMFELLIMFYDFSNSNGRF